MKCATHPKIETNLRCGKCGKPICPKCLVQTPVGSRCRECAGQYRLPTFNVSATHYLKAIGVGLGMAIVTGIVWGLIDSLIPFFYLNLILSGAAGYVIGEVISIAVNRKSSRWLAAIAAVAVVIAYCCNIFIFGSISISPFRIIFDLVALGIGIYMAVKRLV
jgi:hypothetical protein